jgi:hypothetical protein
MTFIKVVYILVLIAGIVYEIRRYSVTNNSNEYIMYSSNGAEIVRKVSDGSTTDGYIYVSDNGRVYKPTNYNGTGTTNALFRPIPLFDKDSK